MKIELKTMIGTGIIVAAVALPVFKASVLEIRAQPAQLDYQWNLKGNVAAGAARPVSFSVSVPGVVTAKTVTGGTCPGPYKGFVTFKDYSLNPPSTWFQVPVGATRCKATNRSQYTAKVEVKQYGLATPWCNTDSLDIPVVPNVRYQFTTYFTTINPPSAGTTVSLDILWY